MAQDWFVVRDGKELGPFSSHQLKQMAADGKLTPDDLVRRGDMKASRKAGNVKGLFQSSASRSSPPDLPEPQKTDDDQRAFPKDRWRSLSKTGKIGVTAGGGVLACMLLCCGGLLIVGAIVEDSGKDRRNATGGAERGQASGQKGESAQVKSLTLANGRVPRDVMIDYLKRSQSLVLNTPKEGSDPSGTPLDRFGEALGEKCRVHVGGREMFGQNVSVVLVETVKDNQIVAVVLGTPMDFSRSPSRGNELTSILSIVGDLLPEAEIRKMVGEERVRLAYGNTSAPKAYGKAAVSIGYNKSAKEFQVTIIADR